MADIPPEEEWLANITNLKTRRAYKNDVREFIAFTGLSSFEELRSIKRAHVIAWREQLKKHRGGKKPAKPTTIRRKLSALSSLLDYLCDNNAVETNPVDGVKRPEANSNEGSTPAVSAKQARRLLEAPSSKTLKGIRDRAILATLLYHGLRREELCLLTVRDLQSRQGVMHFRVTGKRSKIRFIPANSAALRLIDDYLARAGHSKDLDGALFRPVANNRTGTLTRHLDTSAVYRNIVCKYARDTGLSAEVVGIRPHSMRATAATTALDNDADIAKVKDWLGHANISTTQLYDRRKSKPEDSPTFRVKY